jgi:hypothetical protein
MPEVMIIVFEEIFSNPFSYKHLFIIDKEST